MWFSKTTQPIQLVTFPVSFILSFQAPSRARELPSRVVPAAQMLTKVSALRILTDESCGGTLLLIMILISHTCDPPTAPFVLYFGIYTVTERRRLRVLLQKRP